MTSKRKSLDELQDLSDAIDETILGASAAEVDEELALLGSDPEKIAAEMAALTREAKGMAGRLRLARAKDAVTKFRSSRASAPRVDRATLRAKFQKMRSGGESMMMAARKGKQLSVDDEDGALDDLAELEALQSDDPETSKE